MASLLIEIIGWTGMVLILLAYFLITVKKLNSESKTYQGMNLFGAIGIVINSTTNGAYPSAGLNIIWSIVAVYGIIKGTKIFTKK